MSSLPVVGNQGRGTTGWLLDPDERTRLLHAFPPAYRDVIAHHVTLTAADNLPMSVPAHVTGLLLGRIDDGRGLEAMIVEINGTTDRPDGGTYHITWSLDRSAHREARESNAVILRLGWLRFAAPVRISLLPAYWQRERQAPR
jgi:hypothetical protein